MGPESNSPEKHFHQIPCTQEDNVNNLKKEQFEIKQDLHTLFVIIDGNGTGKGMKIDLALAVASLKRIETRLSSEEVINKELEIQARVTAEVQKVREEMHQKELVEKEEMYRKELAKKKSKRETIALIISAIALGITAISFLSKT